MVSLWIKQARYICRWRCLLPAPFEEATKDYYGLRLNLVTGFLTFRNAPSFGKNRITQSWLRVLQNCGFAINRFDGLQFNIPSFLFFLRRSVARSDCCQYFQTLPWPPKPNFACQHWRELQVFDEAGYPPSLYRQIANSGQRNGFSQVNNKCIIRCFCANGFFETSLRAPHSFVRKNNYSQLRKRKVASKNIV